MAESMIFYKSFYTAACKLEDTDRLHCYDAILHYGLTGEIPNVEGVAAIVFDLAKPQIDANIKRRKDGAKGKNFGKRGGRPRKENPIGVNSENPTGVIDENPIGVNSKTPNVNVNVNDNVNVNVNDNDNDNTKTQSRAFIPPTTEEVIAYCQDRGNDIDGQTFVDFYQSKGWMVGKNKMKDWKAAVRTWEQQRGFTPKKEHNSSPERERIDPNDMDTYKLRLLEGWSVSEDGFFWIPPV